jgi:hypothetical protein
VCVCVAILRSRVRFRIRSTIRVGVSGKD